MTVSTRPRCAMLMTVYNGGRYLKPAIDSVLASAFEDFEFVIVDNVSTDGSRDFLRWLSDPRIRLIENETNLGQTGALNVGLHAVSAPYIARLDADDLNESGRLGAQVAQLDADPNLALIGGQTAAIDAEDRVLFRTRFPLDYETIRTRMVLQNCFDHSSVMFRRDAALAVGGYPSEFSVSQDYALFSALLREGHKVANLPLAVSRVRMHPDQVMAQGGSEREIDETIRVAAANQAWASGEPENLPRARVLHRLWSGAVSADARPDDPEPLDALAAFFDANPAAGRHRAMLALLLLGGACDDRLDIRRQLLATALGASPGVVFGGEFWKRLVRAALPASQLGRLRSLVTH